MGATLKRFPILFVIAGLIAFFLLAFVSKFEIFGYSCYYIGSFSPQTFCFKPLIYWGAWLIALGLALLGYARMAAAKKTAPQDGGTDKPA